MTFQNGAIIDTRPPEEQAKDWNQKEVVAAAGQVQWKEKQPSDFRKFPIFNQNGSGSCVAQTQAKELGIMRYLTDGVYVHFSATDIYQRRTNRPGTGMGSEDVRQIAKAGVTLEVLTPSQMMTDSQMDNAIVESYKRQVGAVFSVPNYLTITPKSIDDVAATIQATGKGVMTWFYFNNDSEWTEMPIVKDTSLDLYGANTNRHSVCAVDFTLRGGEKCLVIEDSWGPGAGTGGQRIITERFFKARNWYAGYLINFKFQEQPTAKPSHRFQIDLALGQSNDEVKALQDCLRWDGEFPANAQSTGYFGPITQKAVGDYQIKHGVLASPQAPGYGRVGPNTRSALNLQFA